MILYYTKLYRKILNSKTFDCNIKRSSDTFKRALHTISLEVRGRDFAGGIFCGKEYTIHG